MNFSLIIKDRTNFTLVNGSQEIATIKYNQQSHSVRLHLTERRVFFLEQVGILQNKILLKTEYGVQIGENYYMKHQHKGVLHLTEKKFTYTIQANVANLYGKHRQPIGNFTFDKSIELDSYETSAVMFSLAWFLTNADLNATAVRKASGLYVS